MNKSVWLLVILFAGIAVLSSVWLASAMPPPPEGWSPALAKPTPTARPPLDTPGNLLANPSFEAPYHEIASGLWEPDKWKHWYNLNPKDQYWGRPEFRGMLHTENWYRVNSGDVAAEYFNWSSRTSAGYYQQVNVTPGTKLEARVWVHAWSTYYCSGTPGFWAADGRPTSLWNQSCTGQTIDYDQMKVRVGINPYGGINPNSPDIVWQPESDWVGHYDYYTQTLPAIAYAQSPTVTFFVRSDVKWAIENNDTYWDDASLVILALPAATAKFLPIQPEQPALGELAMVRVESNTALTNTLLTITNPASAVITPPLGAVAGSGPYTWTWQFTPTVPGTHTLVFSAPALTRSLTTTVRAVAVPPQIAVQPPTPWLSQTVTVRIMGNTRYVYLSTRLSVTAPGGVVITPTYDGIQIAPPVYTRAWHFASAIAGAHRITYTDKALEAPVTAGVNVVSVAGLDASPASPPEGAPVVIRAWAFYPYTNVDLMIVNRAGTGVYPQGGPDRVSFSAPFFVWEWDFTPPAPDVYICTFTADGLDAPAQVWIVAGGKTVYLPVVIK